MYPLPDFKALGLPPGWTELINSYLMETFGLSGSRGSAYAYGRMLWRFLRGRDPRAVNGVDVRSWIFSPTRRGGKAPRPTTVRSRLNVIRGLYRRAIEAGLTPADPSKGIRGPRASLPDPRGLSPVELRRLLRAVPAAARLVSDRQVAIREARNRAIVLVAMYTGLRRMEIANLRAGDLLEGTESRERGLWVIVRIKGGDKLKVLLPPPVRLAIADALQVRGLTLQSMRPESPLWRISSSGIGDVFRRLAHASGIRGLTVHRLRHSYCQALDARGLRLEVIQRLVGHRSIATTGRYLNTGKLDGSHWRAIEDVLHDRKPLASERPPTYQETGRHDRPRKQGENG
jgi:integrase